MQPRIILASASKRRSRILRECGIQHSITVSHVEEIHNEKRGPSYNARINAQRKADYVAKRRRSGLVIGADTLVALGRHLIGKPKSHAEAHALLKAFSGKTLSVYTGLCVIDAGRGKQVSALTISKVRVAKIRRRDFKKLLKALEPYDKAGGFSIEGAGSYIFDHVEGSFYNILGLPMITLFNMFKRLGISLLG